MQTTRMSSGGPAAVARRNAKAEAAYRSMRYVGGVAGQPTYEQWMAESTSQAGTWYTVTHDLAGDRYRCSCMAGQHDRECVHQLAAMRKVGDRRREMAAYDALYGTREPSAWDGCDSTPAAPATVTESRAERQAAINRHIAEVSAEMRGHGAVARVREEW